jgi:hypothetical protein
LKVDFIQYDFLHQEMLKPNSSYSKCGNLTKKYCVSFIHLSEMKINDLDKKHIEEKYAALRYSSEHFDKNVLYIASGALGISFAFIEKIVDLKTAVCKGYLFSAWYLFAGVIFISMVSHFVSIRVITWSITNHVYQNEPEKMLKDYTKKQQKQSKWIKGLNGFMMIGLFFGILLFILFIHYNI